jgi:hypothetical protein
MQSGQFRKVVLKNQIADGIETFKKEIQSAYQEFQVSVGSVSQEIIKS